MNSSIDRLAGRIQSLGFDMHGSVPACSEFCRQELTLLAITITANDDEAAPPEDTLIPVFDRHSCSFSSKATGLWYAIDSGKFKLLAQQEVFLSVWCFLI